MAQNLKRPVGSRKQRKAKFKTYEFEGINRISNELVRGQVQAANEKEARRQLGYKNVKINKLKRTAVSYRRITSKDITVFTRQLASMLKAGLPLTQCLSIIAGGFNNRTMSLMVLDIKNDIEQGSSLTSALQKYPKYFDSLYIGLVQAGESGGLLDTSLERVATQREKNARLIGNLRKALIYPAVVVSVSIIVVVFMLVWILPIFESLYDEVGAELPWLTRMVVALSNFIIYWGWIVLIIVILAIVFFVRRYRSNDSFREFVTRFMMKFPVFGGLIRRTETSRWARTFAGLYSSGVPMTETLALISDGTKNLIFKNITIQIEQQVSQGESLVSSVRSLGDDAFPALFTQLAEVGEESGTLDTMMNKAADYFDEEVNTKVSSLESILEPLTIIVLGGIVGIILIAMYLPIISLASAI